MRLKASLAKDLTVARNTLTQRVQGPNSTGTVAVDISRLKEGNIAGLGVFEFPYAYVAVRQENGRKKIVMCNNGEIEEVLCPIGLGQRIWFRSRTTDKDFTARFYYSLNGSDFIPIGNVLQMGLGLVWTANRFALFNYSTKEEGVNGIADFDWFRFYLK